MFTGFPPEFSCQGETKLQSSSDAAFESTSASKLHPGAKLHPLSGESTAVEALRALTEPGSRVSSRNCQGHPLPVASSSWNCRQRSVGRGASAARAEARPRGAAARARAAAPRDGERALARHSGFGALVACDPALGAFRIHAWTLCSVSIGRCLRFHVAHGKLPEWSHHGAIHLYCGPMVLYS